MPNVHCPMCCCLRKVRKRRKTLNPYIKFLKNFIKDHQQRNLPMRTLFVKAGKMWHTLTPDQKSAYSNKLINVKGDHSTCQPNKNNSKKTHRQKSKSRCSKRSALRSSSSDRLIKKVSHCKSVPFTGSKTTHSRSSSPKFCFYKQNRGILRGRRSSHGKRGSSKRKRSSSSERRQSKEKQSCRKRIRLSTESCSNEKKRSSHERSNSREKRGLSRRKHSSSPMREKSKERRSSKHRRSSKERYSFREKRTSKGRHCFRKKKSLSVEKCSCCAGRGVSQETGSSRKNRRCSYDDVLRKSQRRKIRTSPVNRGSISHKNSSCSLKSQKSSRMCYQKSQKDPFCEKIMRKLGKTSKSKDKNEIFCQRVKNRLGIRENKSEDSICKAVTRNYDKKSSSQRTSCKSSRSSVRKSHFSKCCRLKLTRSPSVNRRSRSRSRSRNKRKVHSTSECDSLKFSASSPSLKNNNALCSARSKSNNQILAGFETSSDGSSSFCCCNLH